MTFEVIKPGLLTTIQDLGRPGYFHLGIPEGGAMDRAAMRIANMLVGNPEDAAGLEAVFMGPELTFNDDALVAVAGAEMPVYVDDEERDCWSSFPVKAGQTLKFGYLKSGARIYIAIAGGIDTPPALGSRATYPIGALGGFEGRALAAGDTVPVGKAGARAKERKLDRSLLAKQPKPAELRVLPGLYWHRLTQGSQKQFFADEWKVAPEADRMGYRFRGGNPMEFVEREQPFGAGSDPSNIVDGCYSYGSIQIPGGTEPIVLHRDAVSGGGYFTIGAIISADMDLIGQLQPNMPVKFRQVDMQQSLNARHERSARLERIRAALA
ncbi:biotin-dependent carboxyltransferase family protein [Roseovarius sp. M141]|uniref:5-oxoprolinase subunit C family protein n=1 Tax=Roseovarius sp. M141 TaxID=2583806 RepID=UPI0020CEE120|nr:biotin-dependent carboxyltransferase family protein [Roseovarius sp. M141]MCQ0093733.1 biotin-dependent carboxyltransferase [Roseovarius sp. M141]